MHAPRCNGALAELVGSTHELYLLHDFITATVPQGQWTDEVRDVLTRAAEASSAEYA